MNRRVLVVEEGLPGPAVADLLDGRFDVRTVERGEDALVACERRGPFAAVVSRDELPDMRGLELCRRIARGWPDTVRLLVTGTAARERGLRALHEGTIARLLADPVDPAELFDAVDVALERFRRIEAERLLMEQLQFSRESLLSFAESLERRLGDLVARVHGLQRFSSGLSRASSLAEIARVSAESASALLDRRGVRVVLDDARADGPVQAESGPELVAETHVEVIVAEEGELGHVVVDRRSPDGRALGEKDHAILASVAASVAIAAGHQIRRRERDDARHGTIFALARLAEFRDDETGRHLDRVSEYCRVLALSLRGAGLHVETITDAWVEDLVVSAPLHDIGKVGVPDSILFKPGALDEAEWEVMRKHPTIGAETILRTLENSGEESYLRMAHEIAWCHHERWEGGGYPRGLVGEEIPLAARIMTLADCYDALTTSRPYKSAWTHEATVAHVRRERGRQFDPDVVDAFLRRADEMDRIRERLADEALEQGAA